MTTLVTGGLGFIGLNLAEALLDQGVGVVLFDRHEELPEAARRSFERRPGTYRIVSGDVLDGAALRAAMREHDVTRVIHAAVITPGPEREARDAKRIAQVNFLGALEVIEAAVHHRVVGVLYPSSASVYGAASFDDDLLDEATTVPVPNAIYAISKYAAERTFLRASELWGLRTVVGRVGAAFGPWERDTGVRDTLSGPMLATRLAMRGEEVVLPRPGPRDWVYSRDVATALVALLDTERLDHDVYNVSGGFRWTVADWCERLRAHYPGFSYRISDDPREANVSVGARDRSPLAVERLVTEVMRPSFGLEEAFADYMSWIDDVDDFWTR